MYLLPMCCSLLSFLVSALFGRHLGSRGVFCYTIVSIFICFLSSCYIFYEVCLCQTVCYIRCFGWLHMDLLDVHWGFLFDALSATMLVVITSVSFCAHTYSIEYMRTDPHNIRFFSYLSLFTFFMIFLVVSDNAVQLFLG
jgi:NADH-ubiquinone oxidoreductase chain 5